MSFLRSAIVLLPAAFAVAVGAQVANVDDVVARHLAAMGGLEKMRAIQTSKATGKIMIGGPQGQMEGAAVFWNRRPASQRMEVTMQGQKVVQAFDGKTAWMLNPMMGMNPQIAPPEETKAAIDNADPDGSPLADYKAKGNQVKLLGKEDVNGTVAYKLQVTLRSGSSSLLFLDEKTLLPLKTVAARQQAGQALEVENYSSDYRPVNGVMMPFVTETKSGGRTLARTVIERIEANVPVDDALFAVPRMPTTPRPMPVPRPPAAKQ